MKNVEHSIPLDTTEGFREVDKYHGGSPVGYVDLFSNSS